MFRLRCQEILKIEWLKICHIHKLAIAQPSFRQFCHVCGIWLYAVHKYSIFTCYHSRTFGRAVACKIDFLACLKLTIYTPTQFILPSKLSKYLSEEETENFRKGREAGIQRLMNINLLKRMESSVHSFLLTVQRVYQYLQDTEQIIEDFKLGGNAKITVKDDSLAIG